MYLKFNRLNWFNIPSDSKTVMANDKRYIAMPAKISIPEGAKVTSDGYGTFPVKAMTVSVVGILNNSYVFEGGAITTDGSHFGAYFSTVPISSVTPIWGGNSPLSHVYQWLRSLYRKVVIA